MLSKLFFSVGKLACPPSNINSLCLKFDLFADLAQNRDMALLSKPEILKHKEAGNIVIEPFSPDNLSNTSYDVRLGNFFFRQKEAKRTQTLNPFYEKSIRKMYPEFEKATRVGEVRSKYNPFHGFEDGDFILLISPGETVLGHTVEFIGGRNGQKEKGLGAITTEMRARSSVGRIGVAVCKCAGWGDIGYVNRWTMEITNFSNNIIPLPVGFRIAQIIFHETEPIGDGDCYYQKGKYQIISDLEEMKKSWKPEDMLPKLYKDPDLGNFKNFIN